MNYFEEDQKVDPFLSVNHETAGLLDIPVESSQDQTQQPSLLSRIGSLLSNNGVEWGAALAARDPYFRPLTQSLLEGKRIRDQNKHQEGILDRQLGNKTLTDLAQMQNKTALEQFKADLPTNNVKNYEYLIEQGVPENIARESAFGKGGTTVNVGAEKLSPYEETFQKEAAKDQIDLQKQLSNVQGQSEIMTNNISSARKLLNENKDIVGGLSPIRENAARYGIPLPGGYTSGQMQKRGDLVRTMGAIQNDLLAQAREAGQSGINTAAEIRQATKGIDENSSYEQILGALDALDRANENLRIIKEKDIGSRMGLYSARFGGDRGTSSDTEGQSTPSLSIGSIHSGYRYKGGNPNDKNSWEKIK